MTQQTMPDGTDPNSVRKVMSVQAPPEVAWRVFTAKMGTWWPLGVYKIGKANAVDAVIEPRVGGRWYERGEDGSTCDWGSVLAWEPTLRLVLVLSWDITAHWQYDPGMKTEIEVRFIPEGKNGTRVELEHRRLDRYGARREEMRRIFNAEGDWGRLLQAFAQVAERRVSAKIKSSRSSSAPRSATQLGSTTLRSRLSKPQRRSDHAPRDPRWRPPFRYEGPLRVDPRGIASADTRTRQADHVPPRPSSGRT